MSNRLAPLALLLALAGTSMAGPAAQAAMTIDGMQAQRRVLILFSPADDDRVSKQRAIAVVDGAGYAERDLTLVQVIGGRVQGAEDDAEMLRQRYKVDPEHFAVLLVGKDGNVALRSPAPIASERLFAKIDAMPMRREEMKR